MQHKDERRQQLMHALKEENNFIALYERGELND
jgi:hypothetical protein